MTHHHGGRQPHINSPTTRQLATHVRALRRRQPGFDATVAAIRNGNDQVLHIVVMRAQDGDGDAALTAIWALLPRLCAVVIRRRPVQEWKASIDDYITLAFLTISDVDPHTSTAFLADKIIARTRRRHERAIRPIGAVACQHATLDALAPADNETEQRVMAGVELEELVVAVRAGLLTERAWQNLLRLRFDRSPGTAATDSERSALARAQRRLDAWRAHAA